MEVSYQRRARKHLGDEASEASLRAITNKLDQEYESEPDQETLVTDNDMRSSESEEDDLSFISHSEDFHDIEYVEEWRARNDAQELRLLRKSNCVLCNVTESVTNTNRKLTRIAREIIDLTEDPADEKPSFKRTRFE